MQKPEEQMISGVSEVNVSVDMMTTTPPKRTYIYNTLTLRAVNNYYKKHPDASTFLCAKETRIEYKTVKHYREYLESQGKIPSSPKRQKNINPFRLNKNIQHGHDEYNSVYSGYRASARRHNILFSLTPEYFYSLLISNCYYCDAEPSNVRSVKGSGVAIKYTGIDRVNSKLGYTVDNTRPCCKRCNIAKNDMTENEFYCWIYKISSHSVASDGSKYWG